MSLPAAIEFLAILAYPESLSRRERAEEAMRAYYLRCCKEAGTLKHLGDIPQVQQMRNQFRRMNERLNKRLVAAADCIRFDMNLTNEAGRVSLNSYAREWREERYKSDWWKPEVMHLAIVLRGISLAWSSPLPFSPEALILTWPMWIEGAIHNARAIASDLANHDNPALSGFRKTVFLFPSTDP